MTSSGAATEGLRRALETLRGGLRAQVADEFRRLTETDPGEDHYRMLRSGLTSVAAARENVSRNRYSNILPLDSHRLVLPRNTLRTGKSDFINATLFQGPLHPDYHGPDTCGDFWHAVTANGVGTIVALAKVQPGFSGSSQYFPTADKREFVFDGLRVSLVEETELSADVVRRTIDVALADTASTAGTGAVGHDDTLPALPQRVVHFHYRSFPNYGVPPNTDGLRLIVNEVEQRQVQLLRAATIGDAGAALHQGRGLLVHCSGGVGRTGVFLAAYHTIVSALPRNADPAAAAPYDTATTAAFLESMGPRGVTAEPVVRAMRHQRHPWMVEGPEQYAFVYQVVLEELAHRLDACD